MQMFEIKDLVARVAEREPGFSNKTTPMQITAEQKYVGTRSKEVFNNEIQRTTPWLVHKGDVYIISPEAKAFSPTDWTADGLAKRSPTIIRGEDLAKEELPEDISDVLYTSMEIERTLSEYMLEAEEVSRGYWGINESYTQWGNEERVHGDGLETILMRTASIDRWDIVESYFRTKAQTWELPFPTARMVAIYAYIQERMTAASYSANAKKVKDYAPNVAKILYQTSYDETFHMNGYRKFVEIFAEEDLQGTILDVVYVALNFDMPALNIITDPEESMEKFYKVGSYNRKMVQEVIYQSLSKLSFIPDDLAKAVEKRYGHQQIKRMKKEKEKAKQNGSGNGGSPVGENGHEKTVSASLEAELPRQGDIFDSNSPENA